MKSFTLRAILWIVCFLMWTSAGFSSARGQIALVFWNSVLGAVAAYVAVRSRDEMKMDFHRLVALFFKAKEVSP